MRKNNIRDTTIIVIMKGYEIDDMMDFNEEGYKNEKSAMGEKVKVIFGQ